MVINGHHPARPVPSPSVLNQGQPGQIRLLLRPVAGGRCTTLAGWRLRGYRMAAGDRRWHHGGGPVQCIGTMGLLCPALVPTDSFRLGTLETPSTVIWVGSAPGNRPRAAHATLASPPQIERVHGRWLALTSRCAWILPDWGFYESIVRRRLLSFAPSRLCESFAPDPDRRLLQRAKRLPSIL